MKNVYVSAIFIIGASLISCGGGSSGEDSSTPFFGGVYDVSMVKVSDTCGINSNNSVSFVHSVNQDGRKIVLDSGTIVLEGEVTDSNDGFDVSSDSTSDGCETATGIVYRPTENSNADFGVGLAIVASCGDDSCELTYGGTAKLR